MTRDNTQALVVQTERRDQRECPDLAFTFLAGPTHLSLQALRIRVLSTEQNLLLFDLTLSRRLSSTAGELP